jgi:choice-of-anchor B domain-containing protein
LTQVAKETGAFGGYTVVHRDMKTYQNYLYSVCDEGTSTLQIFDTKYLPDSLHKVYDSNALFTICHNIFIDTIAAKMYACGANNLGMKVLGLSDPENPTLLTDFNNVAYVHDAFVANDTAFLNCGADGLHVYDFSGGTPVQIGLIDFYFNQGYNHSGWMSPSKELYAFIDESEGTKIKLCELGDYGLIQINELFAADEYSDHIPHNVVLLNKTAFVSYYNLGLRIYDVSQKPIKEIAHYDTFTDETNYKQNGAWGVVLIEDRNQVLIADRQNGIFLFSVPIDILESDQLGTVVTSNPFIDENSMILPKDYFQEDGLQFSVFALDGSRVYFQEALINWIEIPLSLSAGAYSFGIYDADGELLESGKFVKAN